MYKQSKTGCRQETVGIDQKASLSQAYSLKSPAFRYSGYSQEGCFKKWRELIKKVREVDPLVCPPQV
ncbi:MAG: hypothetical protein A2283_21590 [Lentisphaerae bacterium RIFOXYA12_FULL_48_11]|nr:MAG: hypothetical protein A2283_21590 [Lentisphaerae bacterium RIFOXYA12_FULL_48_11]